MKSAASKGLLIAFVAIGLAGCAEPPIVTITGATTELGQRPPTMAHVERAILRAGALLDWRMEARGPGLIVGTLTSGTRTAVVEVRYDTRRYEITYVDTTDEDDDTDIRRDNDDHARELEKGIRAQLLNL